MAERLLSWLSPVYSDTRGDKHALLVSQMELKAAAALCDPSFLLVFFSPNLSRSLRQTSGCLPSQEGLQYCLWMGVKTCTACPSILIMEVSQPSLKERQPRVSSPLCRPALNAPFHHVQPLFFFNRRPSERLKLIYINDDSVGFRSVCCSTNPSLLLR